MKISLLLTVVHVLIVILPLGTGQSSCPLSTVADIERELDPLLDIADGQANYNPNVSSYQFTCLAPGTTRDTYHRVSIITTYTAQVTHHFQLQCSSGTWNARTNDGFGTLPPIQWKEEIVLLVYLKIQC